MEAQSSTPRYSFISDSPGLDSDTFIVHQFEGNEEISRPYEFRISLLSNQPLDIHGIMSHSARFVIHRSEGDDVVYHGIPAEFEEIREIRDYIQYEVILVPQMFNLTLSERSRVFLDTTVPELITIVMKDAGLTQETDFELRLQNQFDQMEFVTQYRESNFNFLLRWLEREGIYFWFDQEADREKVIFTDTRTSHLDLSPQSEVPYFQISGLDKDKNREGIHTFRCRHKRMAKSIFIKDYNYEKPSLTVEGRADLVPHGQGEKGVFGFHFTTPEEGDRLAGIQAEALRSQEIQYTAESSMPYLRTGFTFSLTDHYNSSHNRKYLPLKITSNGHQIGYLNSGLALPIKVPANRPEYRNRIQAIPADLQYRMEKKTGRPLISGIIHGRIDSAGEGQYADLDERGRYLVRLAWDLDPSHGPGRCSARVRMIQPYAGLQEGLQFPLRKGAEVSLICTGGDPDRLEIVGAVPNTLCASPVTDRNPTESVISTAGKNEIRLDDRQGQESILMKTPQADTFLRMGAVHDPQPGGGQAKPSSDPNEGIRMYTASNQDTEVRGDAATKVAGDHRKIVGGKDREYIGVAPDQAPTMVDPLETAPDAQKGVHVAGNYHMIADKNVTIESQNQSLKIEMKEDGIHIDAGDQDLFLTANNQKQYINGKTEKHWYDKSTHLYGGDNMSFTMGTKEAATISNSASLHVGGTQNICLSDQLKINTGVIQGLTIAPAVDINWSDYLKLILAGVHLSLNMTLFDLSLSTGIVFKYSLLKVNKNEGINYLEVPANLYSGAIHKINDIIAAGVMDDLMDDMGV